jgi:hypothetical protein
MNFPKEKKQELIQRIRKSKTFAKAPTSSSLLQYLFRATMQGVLLKESVIDIEFFGTSGNTDKESPRVRVNVYNLRKKLISYYENEGKDDPWVVHIEKGQYQISFTKKYQAPKITDKLKLANTLPYLAIIILLFFVIFDHLPHKKPAIWNTFLSKDKPTNLYIGDLFGVIGQTPTGGIGWNRDFEINSLEEFYALCERKPELKDKLKPANYASCTGMAALSAQHFQSLFQSYKKEFAIRFCSQSSISEIKEGNAIYVGPIKNNNQFVSFFNEGNPYLNISNTSLQLTQHPSIKDTVFNINLSGETLEYAIVSKIKGPDKTEHFIFFSQHDYGVSATVEYFTNMDSIEHFSDKYLQDKEYFTAIFLVKGKERTNTDLELKLVVNF